MKRIGASRWTALGAALTLTAGVAWAQTAVNGPYYATPSWDQTLPAATRFLVLSNFAGAAVLDRETGLVWQRAVQAEATHIGAFTACSSAQIGGRLGWRLPTISEVASLFDPTVTTVPSLPSGHPFTGFPTNYVFLWSSTAYSAGYHFTLDNFFNVSFVLSGSNAPADSQKAQYICVRSAGASPN